MKVPFVLIQQDLTNFSEVSFAQHLLPRAGEFFPVDLCEEFLH